MLAQQTLCGLVDQLDLGGRGHQALGSLPTTETKLTHSPGPPPRLWVSASFLPRSMLAMRRSCGCLASQLQPGLEHHPQPGRADRMTERLQPAVRVDRQVAVEVEAARQDVLPALPALGEAEILHQHQFGRCEAVVDLGHREFLARIGDPGLLIGVLGRRDDLRKGGEVVRRIGDAFRRARGEREAFDVQRLVGVAMGVFGAHHDRRRRPVGNAGTVEDAEHSGDGGGVADRLDGHRLAELRPRIT